MGHSLIDKSPTQPCYLYFYEYHGRRDREAGRFRGPGLLCDIVTFKCAREAATIKSQQHCIYDIHKNGTSVIANIRGISQGFSYR